LRGPVAIPPLALTCARKVATAIYEAQQLADQSLSLASRTFNEEVEAEAKAEEDALAAAASVGQGGSGEDEDKPVYPAPVYGRDSGGSDGKAAALAAVKDDDASVSTLGSEGGTPKATSFATSAADGAAAGAAAGGGGGGGGGGDGGGGFFTMPPPSGLLPQGVSSPLPPLPLPSPGTLRAGGFSPKYARLSLSLSCISPRGATKSCGAIVTLNSNKCELSQLTSWPFSRSLALSYFVCPPPQ